MKKTLSILMAVVMLLALAIPAFAADGFEVDNDAEGNGSDSVKVNATYAPKTDSDEVDTVYLVNVTWTVGGDLKYSDGTQSYKWNAEATQYETDGEVTDKGWTGSATVAIEVTNKSNAEVKATASWDNADGITAACNFNGTDDITVNSADEDTDILTGNLTGEAQTGNINATVTVSDGTISAEKTDVGTVTVTIAPADAD